MPSKGNALYPTQWPAQSKRGIPVIAFLHLSNTGNNMASCFSSLSCLEPLLAKEASRPSPASDSQPPLPSHEMVSLLAPFPHSSERLLLRWDFPQHTTGARQNLDRGCVGALGRALPLGSNQIRPLMVRNPFETWGPASCCHPAYQNEEKARLGRGLLHKFHCAFGPGPLP